MEEAERAIAVPTKLHGPCSMVGHAQRTAYHGEEFDRLAIFASGSQADTIAPQVDEADGIIGWDGSPDVVGAAYIHVALYTSICESETLRDCVS